MCLTVSSLLKFTLMGRDASARQERRVLRGQCIQVFHASAVVPGRREWTKGIESDIIYSWKNKEKAFDQDAKLLTDR